jgi:mono/diheme cytochrome c family protein
VSVNPGGRARLGVRFAWAIVGVLLLAPLPAVAQQLGGPTQSASAGSQVFGSKRCAKCHSIDGRGGTVGPDLGRIGEERSLYGLAADMWNHVPRMTERTRQLGVQWPRLSRRQAADLIAFLFTVDYFDRAPDTENGQRLYTGKRCVLCHQVGGVGGVVGPNLDYLADYGSPMQVASAMWNHGPAMTKELAARGLERPSLTGAELLDLIGYIRSGSTAITDEPLYVLPGDAINGSELFSDKGCIQCHSVGGRGGRVGPDLAARSAKRSPIDFAAAMWNKQPKMLATMRSSPIPTMRSSPDPQLSPEEMADLVAYLYSVRYFAGSGVAERGRTIVGNKGCLDCHALNGRGATRAGDLGQVPRLGTPAEVISVLWNHALVEEGAGAPVAWRLFTDAEIADLAAFLQLEVPRQFGSRLD